MTQRLTALLLVVLCLEAFTWKQPKPSTGPTGPVFKCAATVTNNNVTGTLACVQTGDWIVAFSCGNVGTGTQTVTCPAGFTAPATSLSGPSVDGNTLSQKVCYKIATGSDTPSSTYTFTYNGTGAGSFTAAAMDFRGGTTTFDTSTTNWNTSGGQSRTMLAKPVTTTHQKNMVVTAWCAGGTGPGNAFSDVPPGSSATGYVGNPNFSNTMYASYLLAPQAGTTPPQIATFPVAASNGENTFAFGGS